MCSLIIGSTSFPPSPHAIRSRALSPATALLHTDQRRDSFRSTDTRIVHHIHGHLNTLSHSTKAEKDQLKPSSKCMKLRAKNPELKKRGRAHNIFVTHSPWRNKSCVSILTFKTVLSLPLWHTPLTKALMLSRLRGMSGVFRRALLSPLLDICPSNSSTDRTQETESRAETLETVFLAVSSFCFQRGANCTATNHAQGKLNSSVSTD